MRSDLCMTGFLRASRRWTRDLLPDRYILFGRLGPRVARIGPHELPGGSQFMVAPMVVLPVVRKVVAGSVPLEERELYVLRRVRGDEGRGGDAGVPVVAGRRHRGSLGDRGAVAHGEVLAELGGAGGEVVAVLAVGVGGGAVDDDGTGVGVLGEAVARVVPGRGVVDDVGDDLAVAAQLVAVAVAREGRVAPAVLAVAEGPGVLDGDGRGERPEVDAVVRVVVEAGPGDQVAGARAELHGDAVRVLAVVGGVVVAVRVDVLDRVVDGAVAGQREAGVAAVDGLDVVPDGAGAGLADDRAVRGVLERDVGDVPVVGGQFEDPVARRERGAVDLHGLRAVRRERDRRGGRAVGRGLEGGRRVVGAAAHLDDGAGGGAGDGAGQFGGGGDDDGGGLRLGGEDGEADAERWH